MEGFYNQYLKPYFEDDTVVVCVIFLLALILRLSFLPHLIHDPAFVHPVVDCKEHNDLAFEILNINNWRINKFWYHTPGYAYFVAAVYKLLGHSVVRLAVIQYVLGSLAAALVYFMAKRLVNRWAGMLAGVLMSTYWMLVYTQSHVYSENLSMLLNLLCVYILVFSGDSWRKYLLSGMLLGASVVVRPEMLPFAGIVWVGLWVRRLAWRKIFKYYAWFIIGVAFCVLPLLLRNHQLSGHFMFREQIGVNFYMGSMPEYKGSNIYVKIGKYWEEVISKPYQRLGYDRYLTETEMNAFYIKEVLDYMKRHPFSWAGFMAGKIFSVLIGIDFLRTEDVYFYERYIRATPFSLVQTWFICILALWGTVFSFKRERERFIFPLLILVSYLPALFFTYKTRYLVSLMPLLVLFAVYTLAAAAESVRRREWVALTTMICAVTLLYGGVRWNPLDIRWPSLSEMYYAIGVNFEYFGDYGKAEEYFVKALEVDPENLSAINDLGAVNMQTGQFARAAENFQRALRLKDDPLYHNNYRVALEYLKNGGDYNYEDFYSEEFRNRIVLYHYYFPYPYQGPIYHKSTHEILAGQH